MEREYLYGVHYFFSIAGERESESEADTVIPEYGVMYSVLCRDTNL